MNKDGQTISNVRTCHIIIIISYYIILYHILYHIISHYIILYHIISYHIISYYITSYHQISHWFVMNLLSLSLWHSWHCRRCCSLSESETAQPNMFLIDMIYKVANELQITLQKIEFSKTSKGRTSHGFCCFLDSETANWETLIAEVGNSFWCAHLRKERISIHDFDTNLSVSICHTGWQKLTDRLPCLHSCSAHC